MQNYVEHDMLGSKQQSVQSRVYLTPSFFRNLIDFHSINAVRIFCVVAILSNICGSIGSVLDHLFHLNT